MLPPRSGSPDERRLLKRFRALAANDRETLLAFADFLQARHREVEPETVPDEPCRIDRPERETVVGAIKRLSRTYPMLEREALLGETSALMSAHVLQGRSAKDVIDELEAVFTQHYAEYRKSRDQEG